MNPGRADKKFAILIYMDESSWDIGQLIVGLMVAFVGFIVVWKADWMLKNFGSVPFAEKFLQTEGGTRLFYKLLGILVMVGGIMHATDLLGTLMSAIIERLFGGYQ